MTNKKLFLALVVVISSLTLSACSTTTKVSLEGQIPSLDTKMGESVSPTTTMAQDPSNLSDEQLLLQMESESDASIDQEFSRLEKELE